jgi:HK97 family phage prohead protease
MSEQELWVTHYPVELRSDTRGSRTIVGTAAVFNSDSRNLGGFIERVLPSFCDRSLAAGWAGIVCRFNHDDNYVLGNTDSGTLRVSRDARGMNYECDLPRSQEMVREAIERGDIRTSSMAFTLVPGVDDTWEPRDGLPLRTLSGGTILDVAPVAIAAYAETSCALRSLAHFAEADYEDVKKAARDGELRKFVIRTDGATPVPPAPEPVAAKPKAWGRQALIKTLEATPNGPARLLDTLAARSVSDAERLAQTTVEGQLATARAELASTRADIARLSDPNRIELEDARAEVDRADQRARDELDRTNGTLSGAAALRLMGAPERRADADDFAREDEVGSDYADPGYQPDKQPRYPLDTAERITLAWGYIHNEHDQSFYSPQQLAAIKDRIQAAAKAHRIDLDDLDTRSYERWVPRPTLTGAEALRRTMALALPEPVRNAGRACDQYGAEQGGRF